jgi:hypothetical protein
MNKTLALLLLTAMASDGPRPHIEVRGIYGGVPSELLEGGRTLTESGVNAVWLSSGSLNLERLTLLKQKGVRVFAEFNSMHAAEYLKEHPDAAPVGADGSVSPPPDGWQGLCPTHPGYRESRMRAFRSVLENYDVDGVWLDYHHSHAAWERSEPILPDTCFCTRCLAQFQRETGARLPPQAPMPPSALLLGEWREPWSRWRAGVFTGWVRQYRQIRDEVRPRALLGTFHCPWSDTDFDGGLYRKLAIDLKAQSQLLDVLSPMPYHARFGHSADPAWISRQVAWLGRYLGLEGRLGERPRIWPIVQLSDWGDKVPVAQVAAVLEHGTRSPATGIMVFAWSGLRTEGNKVAALSQFFLQIRP